MAMGRCLFTREFISGSSGASVTDHLPLGCWLRSLAPGLLSTYFLNTFLEGPVGGQMSSLIVS
jgi:hypothetical protein